MSKTAEHVNQILAALPAGEYNRLLPNLEEVSLIYTETIFEPSDIIRYVYFPNSGMISLLTRVKKAKYWKSQLSAMKVLSDFPCFSA